VTEIREFPDSRGSAFVTTQITFDRGTLPSLIRTIGVLDANNNLASGNGIVERRFTYDNMWRVLSETDPNSHITGWQYDRLGRVTQINLPNGGFATYIYDDRNNRITHRTVLGATYTYQYDKALMDLSDLIIELSPISITLNPWAETVSRPVFDPQSGSIMKSPQPQLLERYPYVGAHYHVFLISGELYNGVCEFTASHTFDELIDELKRLSPFKLR